MVNIGGTVRTSTSGMLQAQVHKAAKRGGTSEGMTLWKVPLCSNMVEEMPSAHQCSEHGPQKSLRRDMKMPFPSKNFSHRLHYGDPP